jgi:DtxR family Mn-dependent transcriptional regulator
VVVARVSDRDREDLEYLEDAGITPDTTLELVDVAPFGMVTVRVDGEGDQSLPESVAESIRVRDAADADAPDERGAVTDA